MSFKTQAEIYQALLDGKKVTYFRWPPGEFAHLKEGFIVDEKGQAFNLYLVLPQEWSIVEEPKPPRKLYAWRQKSFRSVEFFIDDWMDEEMWEKCPQYDIEYPASK